MPATLKQLTRRSFIQRMAAVPVLPAAMTGQQQVTSKPAVRPETLKPWAGVEAEAWTHASKATMVTDMNQCIPASALSPQLRRSHWKVIPYEFGGVKGNMIWASAEQGAPALELPLEVKGWHAIFVGIYPTVLAPSM